MKLKLLILFVLGFVVVGWAQKSASKYLAFSEGKVYWIVTENTTNKDLEYIEQTLAKKDVYLRFWGVRRDTKGKITSIEDIPYKYVSNIRFAPMMKAMLRVWNTPWRPSKRPLLFHFTPNYGCEVDFSMFGFPESLRQVAKKEGIVVEPTFSQMDTFNKRYASLMPQFDKVITGDIDGPKLKEMSALGLKGWLVYVRPDECLDIVEKYRDSTQIFVGDAEITLAQLQQMKVGEIGKVHTHQRPKMQNNKPVVRRPQDKEYVVWIELTKPVKP